MGIPVIPGPSYQPLRAPQFNPSNWLDAYRVGTADRQQEEKRNLLKDVGGDMAAGNPQAAAAKAYAGGDVNTGLSLTKYKHDLDLENRDTQLKVVTFVQGALQRANTEEMRKTVFDMADNIFGADKVAPMRNVPIDQLIAGFGDRKSELELEKLKAQTGQAQSTAALNRGELESKNQQRALQRNVLESFGLMPGGMGAAPAYTPSPRTDVSPSFAPSAPTAPTDIAVSPSPGAAPPVASPPSSDAAAPPVQDVIAKMTPAQKSALGLLVAKEDYSGAAKLIKEASETNAYAPFKDAKEKAGIEESLRKEYADLAAPYFKVRDSYTRIQSSAKKPSPAGDLSMIFNYMKMLDPGSVVRESEFATASRAKPLMEQYGIGWNAVQAVWQGKKLTDEQRADFLNRADELYAGQNRQYQKMQAQYRGIGSRTGVNVENTILDYGQAPEPKEAPDGKWYIPDPARPGKYLRVDP